MSTIGTVAGLTTLAGTGFTSALGSTATGVVSVDDNFSELHDLDLLMSGVRTCYHIYISTYACVYRKRDLCLNAYIVSELCLGAYAVSELC